MKKEFIILDLECTCDNRGEDSVVKRNDMEIIEIGAIISDLKGNIKDEKIEILIKPITHPTLTDFCTELTTITQKDVDNGTSLIKAIQELNSFAEKHQIKVWGSWGFFDYNQFKREATRKNIDLSEFYFFKEMKHVNLSLIYQETKKFKNKKGIRKALVNEGLDFVGVQHRAINDVINIARIIGEVNKKEIKIDI